MYRHGVDYRGYATKQKQRPEIAGEVQLFLLLAMLLFFAWKVGPWTHTGVPIPVLSGFEATDNASSGSIKLGAISSLRWADVPGPASLPANIPGIGTSESVVGPPTITVTQIRNVLMQYHSPATPYAQQLYDLGVEYGIDPAYALAFFVHESGCGTTGVARITLSLGNIKWTPDWPRSYEGFRQYISWPQGFADWYALIRNLYVAQWKLDTVPRIIPVYAPAWDHNDVQAYIDDVESLVAAWRAGADS
jgi:hypothetical protein